MFTGANFQIKGFDFMKDNLKETQNRCQFVHKNNQQSERENFQFTLNLIFKGKKVKSIKMMSFFINLKLALVLMMELLRKVNGIL